MRIKKLTLGIRPSQKMFRLSSVQGTLVDSVLTLRGTKPIDDEYYTEVSRGIEPATIQLRNDELGNTLTIELDNVVFTKDLYDSDKQFDLDEVLKEFRTIWKQVNDVLHVKDIRRIGIVVEHQLAKENPSSVLIKQLTSLTPGGHVAKFLLHFEERFRTGKGGIPDPKTDDFINVICDYYDSERDIDHPKEGHINVNLDVQRYYSPLFNGNVFDEITVFRQQLSKEQSRFEQDLKKRGLL